MPGIVRTAPKISDAALLALMLVVGGAALAADETKPHSPLDLRVPLAETVAPVPGDDIPEVTVYGSRDPLADADERLRRLQEGLPCAECGTADQRSLVIDVLKAAVTGFLPAEAPQRERDPLQRAVSDSRFGICAPDHMEGCSREQLP